MFGIIFTGHPDLTRILMPEDWEGHPLRKDYRVGRVPVQFKEARAPMSEPTTTRVETTEGRSRRCSTRDETSRARAAPRARLGAAQSRGVGAGGPEEEPGRFDQGVLDMERTDDDTMIINFGPQHPSTHGVLRLMMELDGETVVRSKPIIGYLHTGMEKTGEELTYQQGATNVTRMDYLSPAHQRAGLLLGDREPCSASSSRPGRSGSGCCWPSCKGCRRISCGLATNGMDLGSTTMMIFGFREREMILGFFEKTTGLRMNHNFIRPGGTAADLPDGWEDDVEVIFDNVATRLGRLRRALHRTAHLPRADRGGRGPHRR